MRPAWLSLSSTFSTSSKVPKDELVLDDFDPFSQPKSYQFQLTSKETIHKKIVPKKSRPVKVLEPPPRDDFFDQFNGKIKSLIDYKKQ
jgi:hypothetical protein